MTERNRFADMLAHLPHLFHRRSTKVHLVARDQAGTVQFHISCRITGPEREVLAIRFIDNVKAAWPEYTFEPAERP